MIIIEGQIGAGKTTLCNILAKHFKIPVCEEISSNHTLNILNDFYSNKSRWSFLSQVHFLTNRIDTILNMQKQKQMHLMDRSIFGDSIFAEFHREQEYMNEQEYFTYTSLLNRLIDQMQTPKFMCYLDCSIETAMNRISKRDREFERSKCRCQSVRYI